jgi:meso-butanediol dehydrogenase/(S,S)-butanediol dehydrogenase/diacetyl reductase
MSDRVALISGAAGGIGGALARRFAADGYRLALTDVAADRLGELAEELGALALPADGSARAPLAEVVERAVAQLGGLDALIAAQGLSSPGPADARGDDAWSRSLAVNLEGAYFLCGEALPHLVARRGSIVFISSSAGIVSGPPGTVGYTAAKHGIVGLMRYFARELGPRGVRVNAVCPGWVRTNLGEDAMTFLARRDGLTVEEAYARATAYIPLRRPCEPEEIAAVCAFLASADASIVTGHTLVADGGGSAMDVATAVFDPPPR